MCLKASIKTKITNSKLKVFYLQQNGGERKCVGTYLHFQCASLSALVPCNTYLKIYLRVPLYLAVNKLRKGHVYNFDHLSFYKDWIPLLRKFIPSTASFTSVTTCGVTQQ